MHFRGELSTFSTFPFPFRTHPAVALEENALLHDKGTSEDVAFDPGPALELELPLGPHRADDRPPENRLGGGYISADEPVMAHGESSIHIYLPLYGSVHAKTTLCPEGSVESAAGSDYGVHRG